MGLCIVNGRGEGAAPGTPRIARCILQIDDDVICNVEGVATRGTDELLVSGDRGNRDHLESRGAVHVAVTKNQPDVFDVQVGHTDNFMQ